MSLCSVCFCRTFPAQLLQRLVEFFGALLGEIHGIRVRPVLQDRGSLFQYIPRQRLLPSGRHLTCHLAQRMESQVLSLGNVPLHYEAREFGR